ncbi:MAG: HAF repeat-containing protein [Myxococcota bacterium]|nr:HAF repeat-containing protein [Myxococcota bacterium]
MALRVAWIILVFGVAQPSLAAPLYQIVDLGTFAGSRVVANDLNDLGQIAGHAGTHAVVYTGGVVEDLGSLGGRSSRALGINNAGEVVGYSDDAQGARRGFVDVGSGMRELGTLGGSFSIAYAINESGVIVGSSQTPAGDVRAVRFEAAGPVDLGTVGGGYSQARAIDSAGRVAGQSDDAAGERHAFRELGGSMTDLGTLGGPSSFGYGINDSGHVVGQSTDVRGQQRAFVHDGLTMRELMGLLPDAYGVAFDINGAGVVVGSSGGGATGLPLSAVLFDPVLGPVDLNDLIDPDAGWALTQATAINERGQIVGNGFRGDEVRSFLMTPVPLPAMSPMVAAGLAGLAGVLSASSRRRGRGGGIPNSGDPPR